MEKEMKVIGEVPPPPSTKQYTCRLQVPIVR
jgi:hypothetical protein